MFVEKLGESLEATLAASATFNTAGCCYCQLKKMESLELSVRAESHQDRGSQIQGVVILFIVLTTLSVWMRTYCRAVVIKSFGWDDTLAVVAWVRFLFWF